MISQQIGEDETNETKLLEQNPRRFPVFHKKKSLFLSLNKNVVQQ